MIITYILGNGFDLQLGLKSRYSDFLKEYANIQDEGTENLARFKKYLKSEEGSALWSDAERAMGTHCEKVLGLTIVDFTERIRDFETHMFDYLLKQQTECSWEDTAKIKRAFRDFFLGSFADVINRRSDELNIESKPENHTYYFVTFNYTDLIDTLVKISIGSPNEIIQMRSAQGRQREDRLGNVYHVHGSLASQIIMGVNDDSQISLGKDLELTDELRWQLIKPDMNRAANHNWDKPARTLIQKSDVLLIYGVSYGETDRLWWNDIKAWLKENATHKLVIFEYDPTFNISFRLPWEEAQYERKKRGEILFKLGFQQDESNYESILNQIYIIVNTKRLNLKDLLSPSSNAVSIAANGVPESSTELI